MKNLIVILLAVAILAVFTACNGGAEPILAEQLTTTSAPPTTTILHTTLPTTPPPTTTAPPPPEPLTLTATAIPNGADPGEFLRGLGFASFADYEHLRWGTDWVALHTNIPIQDLRIIAVRHHYEAVFNNGWHFTRYYSHSWTRHTLDLLLHEPFVMRWNPDEEEAMWNGLTGVSFTDENGQERFFILRKSGDTVNLEEFENTTFVNSPGITIVHPTPAIELVVAWITHEQPDEFLQQFAAYTTFDCPFSDIVSRVVFSANKDLHYFRFFRWGICAPLLWAKNGTHFM